jgi:hypothetical protein
MLLQMMRTMMMRMNVVVPAVVTITMLNQFTFFFVDDLVVVVVVQRRPAHSQVARMTDDQSQVLRVAVIVLVNGVAGIESGFTRINSVGSTWIDQAGMQMLLKMLLLLLAV